MTSSPCLTSCKTYFWVFGVGLSHGHWRHLGNRAVDQSREPSLLFHFAFPLSLHLLSCLVLLSVSLPEKEGIRQKREADKGGKKEHESMRENDKITTDILSETKSEDWGVTLSIYRENDGERERERQRDKETVLIGQFALLNSCSWNHSLRARNCKVSLGCPWPT